MPHARNRSWEWGRRMAELLGDLAEMIHGLRQGHADAVNWGADVSRRHELTVAIRELELAYDSADRAFSALAGRVPRHPRARRRPVLHRKPPEE